MTTYPCTIGLGSNTPDREEQIQQALVFLGKLLADVKHSSVYESKAFNGIDDPYMNAVVHGQTALEPEKLIDKLKEYESDHGRVNKDIEPEGNVSIDLDLVIYNYRILRQEDFQRHYFNRGYRELLADGAFVSEA
ncbi:MAG: 2-amino-4-hydroxy-6-hydroxymethyldihydropteridine diphosphokinase [Duncaniella sp.]|nr:2-amino-4-hydroxy-6-hydroxymethyldihydropteridine diphosphokinase [Duncaniella sp.]